MMWAEPTPPRIASTQAASFGRMPPATPASDASTSATVALLVSESGSSGSASQPPTSVRKIALCAAQRGRDLARRGVGVDVVGAAAPVDPGGGDHRDVVGGDVVEHVDVDALDLADQADPLGIAVGRDLKQRAVLAGEPDRRLAVAVEPHDDVGVDLAEQDHLRHLDGLGVRDPDALDEAHLHPEALHVAGDVGAAAVDDHRVQADVLEQDDVGGELVAQILVLHRRAAVLDHDRAAVELADVGQRLEERLDVCRHVVYSC